MPHWIMPDSDRQEKSAITYGLINKHVPLPRTAQNDLTTTYLIGIVIRWKPLGRTFSNHVQLTRETPLWFAIVGKLNV
jgi:hypothetical protein